MPDELQPNLDSLVALFYSRASSLGSFQVVSEDETPTDYRNLLAHNHHMTVTVEAFHSSPVDVEVISVTSDAGKYCRRILLRRRSDGQVVQFGIVRINLELLELPVRQRIIDREAPLGRILIEHNVLREVELDQVYRVRCGTDLAELFSAPQGTSTYGVRP